MDTTVTTGNEENVWDGGNRPLGASYGKLMMWFFIVSDALTFSGFLAEVARVGSVFTVSFHVLLQIISIKVNIT